MSEVVREAYETSTIESLEVRLEALRGGLRDQTENPPGDDPFIMAFSEAMLEQIDANPVVYKLVREFLKARPTIDSTHASFGNNILLRAFQKPLMREADSLDYPRSFATAERW